MASQNESNRPDTYRIITDRIVEMLEQGTPPWRKPWSQAGPARSMQSGKVYTGCNAFFLNAAPFETPYWITFKQAKELGGHVKKGEHGYPCIFWKMYQVDEKNARRAEDVGKTIPFLKHYTVFNLEQTEGIDCPEDGIAETWDHDPIEEAEAIQLAMPNRPHVDFEGNRPFYRPSTDTVTVPRIERYENVNEYYSTLFHELAHSTGHESRLNRPGIVNEHRFGDAVYSKEELIAEMTSAFLCAHCHIEQTTIENSAAYIQGWLKALRNDNKLFIQAAATTQKVADYILNKQ